MDAIMLSILMRGIYGPAAKQDVFRDLHQLQKINKRTFDRKIAVLEKNKFIRTKPYINFDHLRFKGHQIDVVILTDAGATMVCNACSQIDKASIRTAVPSLKNIMHDIYVSRIVRKIWDEASAGYYQVLELKDEVTTRREYKDQNKSLKGVFLPDFFLQAQKGNATETIYLEFDGGSKAMTYWSEKISSWCGIINPPLVLVLALNPERLNKLFEMLKNSKVRGRICLIQHDDFMKKTLNPVLSAPADMRFICNTVTGETWRS